MKKLILRGLALLPLLLLVVGVNLAVDPGNLFSRNDVKIAQAILQGKNVANFPNLDDRSLQKRIIEGRDRKLDVVTVGSSRSMEIRADFFPGRTFHNSWVGSACLPDYVGIYEACRDRGMKPALFVIAADPWILNRNYDDQRWRSLQKEYDRFAEREGITRNPDALRRIRQARKLAQLVSPKYLQSSLKSLRGDASPEATDETSSPTQMLLKDGSQKYPQAVLDRSVAEVRAIAAAFFRTPGWTAISGFERLNETAVADFEKFVRALRRDGVEVLIYLPPYHPVVYRDILANADFKMVPAAEDYFRRFARESGVPLIGSCDPSLVPCGEEDFRDGMHVADRAIRPLFLKFSSASRKSGG